MSEDPSLPWQFDGFRPHVARKPPSRSLTRESIEVRGGSWSEPLIRSLPWELHRTPAIGRRSLFSRLKRRVSNRDSSGREGLRCRVFFDCDTCGNPETRFM